MLGDNWNKFDSLEYLKGKGINTPESYLARNNKELVELLANGLKDENILSIRSFMPKGTTFNEPFYPNHQIDKQFINTLQGLLNKGYYLILSKPIEIEDTLFKGTLAIYPSSSMRRFDYLIECTEGSGTVRDMETTKSSDILAFENIHEAIGRISYEIMKIFQDSLSIYRELDQSIITEWGLYNKPVGMKKKRRIFWEVRKGHSTLC